VLWRANMAVICRASSIMICRTFQPDRDDMDTERTIARHTLTIVKATASCRRKPVGTKALDKTLIYRNTNRISPRNKIANPTRWKRMNQFLLLIRYAVISRLSFRDICFFTLKQHAAILEPNQNIISIY